MVRLSQGSQGHKSLDQFSSSGDYPQDEESGWSIMDLDAESVEDYMTAEILEEHRSTFETQFQENQVQEIPTHPTKIERRIVENHGDELSIEEKAALRMLKKEYQEKWLKEKEQEIEEESGEDDSVIVEADDSDVEGDIFL